MLTTGPKISILETLSENLGLINTVLSKQVSDIFIAKVPSLNDLFSSYEAKEEDIISEAQKEFELVRKLKSQIEKARLELLKADEPDWEQQQAIKNSLEEAKDQIENFQKLSEKLDQLNNQANKHELFSDNMIAKFRDLQKLIEEIFPPELMKNFDWMQEALENMDIDEMINDESEIDEMIIDTFTTFNQTPYDTLMLNHTAT